MTLPQDALRGCGRPLEISDAEIFNRCAQEHAVPSFKRTGMPFERYECFLQIVNGTATPKKLIERRMRFFLFAGTGLDVVRAVGRHGLNTQHLLEGLRKRGNIIRLGEKTSALGQVLGRDVTHGRCHEQFDRRPPTTNRVSQP
jgi:hypothetical protein